MKYQVEVQFSKGPAFSTEVIADTQSAAEKAAVHLAKQCGYTLPAKKVIARPQE